MNTEQHIDINKIKKLPKGSFIDFRRDTARGKGRFCVGKLVNVETKRSQPPVIKIEDVWGKPEVLRVDQVKGLREGPAKTRAEWNIRAKQQPMPEQPKRRSRRPAQKKTAEMQQAA